MRIAVIGAGAVGGYFGGRLALAGNDVVFLARGKTLEALRAGPLRVESIKGDFEIAVRATDDPASVGAVDAVLVAVKSWQVREAANAIQKMPERDSVVVPLQNGLETPEQLAAIIGPERVAGGYCGIVAEAIGPAHIRHKWAEPFVAFGEIQPLARRDRLEQLREAFLGGGVRCEIPSDIVAGMWQKFLFMPWGALAAMMRTTLGPLCNVPESRAKLRQALQEVADIACARGVNLPPDSVDKALAHLDGVPEETTSSMQRDIMAGRPSELEAQTGLVVRLGRLARVATPMHDSIYAALLPQEQRARGAI